MVLFAVFDWLNPQLRDTTSQTRPNPVLIDLLERLMVHMAQVPSTALTSPGRQDSALQEHRAMVKAISKRDAVTARDITR